MKSKLALVIYNVRSAHNVGSMLRSADGLGVDEVIISGFSPYPLKENDERLPHLAKKAVNGISKTALGAENSLSWQHIADINDAVEHLKDSGYRIILLEQTKKAQDITKSSLEGNIAVVVGNEVDGIDENLQKLIPDHIFIPMNGKKESFNVGVAAAIAMYQIKLKNDGHLD